MIWGPFEGLLLGAFCAKTTSPLATFNQGDTSN